VKDARVRLSGEAIVTAVAAAMVDRKAEEIAIFDMRGVSTVSDWFLICSANGPVHGRALAQGIVSDLRDRRQAPVYHEGVEDGRWALIDYVDVVAHVMIPELREYYQIEELWHQGRRCGPAEFAREG